MHTYMSTPLTHTCTHHLYMDACVASWIAHVHLTDVHGKRAHVHFSPVHLFYTCSTPVLQQRQQAIKKRVSSGDVQPPCSLPAICALCFQSEGHSFHIFLGPHTAGASAHFHRLGRSLRSLTGLGLTLLARHSRPTTTGSCRSGTESPKGH